jgi:pimeloyl-ACP methyl ester carboxylesterase
MDDIYQHKGINRHVGSFPLERDLSLQLHYVIHGKKQNSKKIMLIMGFTTDGINWYNTVDYYTRKGFSVLTFDNLGNGRSSDPSSIFNLSIYSMCCDALALLDHLQWETTTTHIVGVSMGGMITLEMLAKRKFQTGTLIVTTGCSALWFPLHGIWHMARTLFDPTLTTYDRSMLAMEQNFDREWLNAINTDFVHPNPSNGNDKGQLTNAQCVIRIGAKIWYAKKNDGIAPDPSFTGTMSQMWACINHHVSEKKLRRIKNKNGPLLIVGAKKDKMVRVEGSVELKNMLEPFEFLVVESGHGLVRQCSEVLHSAMERLFEYERNTTSENGKDIGNESENDLDGNGNGNVVEVEEEDGKRRSSRL